MTLDIIIPCYNATDTLERAVASALRQSELHRLWLIDDASTDGRTWPLIRQLANRFPDTVRAQKLPENGGPARARNWGALCSGAELVAFLDADDAYEDGALAAARFAMRQYAYLGLVRLKLKAVGLPERYTNHPGLADAWRTLEMTAGGNTVFRRHFLLACGGFPQDGLFRTFGGEDAALGIACTRKSVVGTLFDEGEPAVLHHCHDGMHALRLLELRLFGNQPEHILPEHLAQAEAVSAAIARQLDNLTEILSVPACGIMPLTVS